MAKKRKEREWVVECKITGTVSVYVDAVNDEDAFAKAEAMDFKDSEITGWEITKAIDANPNK